MGAVVAAHEATGQPPCLNRFKFLLSKITVLEIRGSASNLKRNSTSLTIHGNTAEIFPVEDYHGDQFRSSQPISRLNQINQIEKVVGNLSDKDVSTHPPQTILTDKIVNRDSATSQAPKKHRSTAGPNHRAGRS